MSGKDSTDNESTPVASKTIKKIKIRPGGDSQSYSRSSTPTTPRKPRKAPVAKDPPAATDSGAINNEVQFQS